MPLTLNMDSFADFRLDAPSQLKLSEFVQIAELQDKELLKRCGLSVHEVASDGACLFRASFSIVRPRAFHQVF